ncbi:MAG: M48 family metallopeptidase [Oligoflexus sp.]
MNTTAILATFIGARLIQHVLERYLARLNKSHYEQAERLQEAARVLKIDSKDLEKTLNYSRDKYAFGNWSGWIQLIISLLFIALGGLGWVESLSKNIGDGPIVTGLAFFAILGLLSSLVGLPFEWYYTFHLEEKHGFNRQTKKGFWIDRLKGLALTVVLGGLLLSALFWVMDRTGSTWWVYAWALIFGFSLLTVWLYPTFLAPLFNKFTPVEEGELRDQIYELAKRVDFQADGISIMDASRRSAHGNAYFTGVFGKKKIVLFDTLVKSMSTTEITAVLAHELGHFKLHHIRWGLIRSFFSTGIIFFLIALLMPYDALYHAFHLSGSSYYGALTVFSLWFGVIGFFLQPISSLLSRRNEFAADAFALQHIDDKRRLGDALLKLRETSHVMPISHPLFSAVYHSHPPLLERLRAMRYI